MENFRKIVTYKFYEELAKDDISSIQMKLAKIDGVKSFEIFPKLGVINYLSLKFTEESVSEIFKGIGYPVKTERKKRPRIVRKVIDDNFDKRKNLLVIRD